MINNQDVEYIKLLLEDISENYHFKENDNEIICNCFYCGRSKSNKPHLGIDLSNQVFNCFRCNTSGTLYYLLSSLYYKSNKLYCIDLNQLSSHKKYIKQLIYKYKNVYTSSFNKNNTGHLSFSNISNDIYYNVNLNRKNIIYYKNNYPIREHHKQFIKNKINIYHSDNNYYNKTRMFSENDNILSFLSFFGNYKYLYKFNDKNNLSSYQKFKYYVNRQNYSKKIKYYDFYTNVKIINKNKPYNIYVCEGIFDNLSIYHYFDKFAVKNENMIIISMNGKYIKQIIKYIFHLVINTKYDIRFSDLKHLFIIPDNDVNIYHYLNMFKNNNKIYKDIYYLEYDKKFKDINELLVNCNFDKNIFNENINIKKT